MSTIWLGEGTVIAQPLNMEAETENTNPVLILLEFDSLDQLEALPVKERHDILSKHLVAEESLELDESHNSTAEPEERALRIITGRGGNSDDFEGQLADEARRIFYQENQFVMWSTHLEAFLQGDYGDQAGIMPVSELARDVVIGLPCCMGDFEANAKALQEALCFTHLDYLSIEFWGHGALNGSDHATQRMLYAVSNTVKQLKERKELHLTILKVLADWNNFGPYPHHGWMEEVRDLRPYWETPTDEAISRVKEGDGSFEELMQVQMAVWTDPSFVSYWFDYVRVAW